MKAFVITMIENSKSVKAAERCIASAKKFGIDAEVHSAMTPEKGAIAEANIKEVPLGGFKEDYSRFENCLSAFLSHLSLWEKCVKLNEPIIIFEHDAVVVNDIPSSSQYNMLMNIGKPSYGMYNTGNTIGTNLLFSKKYLPGAHAYTLKPAAADELIRSSKTGKARPTDIFINKIYFPWIQEYYPWPVEARDSFTTIQNERGIVAKHNYTPIYEII